jgi:hypothetical protein
VGEVAINARWRLGAHIVVRHAVVRDGLARWGLLSWFGFSNVTS